MPYLPPAHHETSKHDSPNETKIKVKQLNRLRFKFKPHQVNDSSQSNQGIDHLVSHNLYLVDFSSNDASLSTCLFTKSSKGWFWHRRLPHVEMNQLKKLMKHDLVISLNNDIIFEKNKLCSAYQAGKQVGNTHPIKSVMSTSRPMELLHMDLFDPTTYRSIGGNSYGLVVVDDYSRYTWGFFHSDKSNVFSIFKGFTERAKNEFDFKINKIRSDNGSEFKNSRIEDYCDEKGVKHEFSAKYTPQQNGVVERKNQILIDMARSMLWEYNVSDNFRLKKSTPLTMLQIDYIVIDC
jgi:transposase InsO family protein